MVRIIDNPTSSFSERVSRGLHASVPHVAKGLESYREREDKKAVALDKRHKESRKFSDAQLKRFHESIYQNEKSYNSFNDRMKGYVDQGYSDDDALRASLADVSKQRKEAGGTLPGETKKLGHGDADKDKFVGGALGRYLEPAKEAIKKNPAVLASELPVAAAKSQKNLETFHDPGSNFLANAIRAFSPKTFDRRDEKGRPLKPNTIENMLAGHFRNGMSEEEQEGADRVSDVESALLELGIPLPGLKGAKIPTAKGVAAIERAAEREAQRLPAQVGRKLEGSVAREAPRGATLSRVERAAPEGKLFKTAEQQAIREKQVKLFPEYAEEIAQDAAERALRAEAKVPKTDVGRAGMAKRIQIAESQVPKAQELFQKAAARVRGLESQMAKGFPPAKSGGMEQVYNEAIKELKEADFYLRTVLNNAKTGEARVGLEGMTQAARNKMINLEEKIAAGETPEFSLKDYNPKFIKQAKEIQKKKAIPSTRHEDYFTQVHEGYANEYRNRIAALEKQAEENIAKQPSDFSKASQRRLIDKKKESLQKLIDHVEAENSIHRHKMALRETEQRKVAQERLGKFTKQAGEERVRELAKEAFKSPEKAAEATEAAFDQVASQAKNPSIKDKILKERQPVRNKMEQIAKGEGKAGAISGELDKGPKNSKQAHKWGSKIIDDLKEVFNSLRGEGPTFFNTRLGGDFLIGAGTEFVKEAFKEFDIPLSHSAALAAALGRPGRGSVYRALISSLTRAGIDKYKKEQYKKALEQGDDEKLIEFKSSYPSKLRKEALQEYRISHGSL